MRVLIFGGTGMLGHKVWQVFEPRFDTWMTARMSATECLRYPFFKKERIIGNFGADNPGAVESAIEAARPDAIVNCIGIIKRLKESDSPIPAITINALLPHWIHGIAEKHGIRLIHVSTDCVFSGTKGNYTEDDIPDAHDLYGRTKVLGEITGNNTLTIRTSIIGRELRRDVSLLEWFLGRKGQKVQGYKNAIFSGFITKVLAEILAKLVHEHKSLSGLYHVSSDPISKFKLLQLINEALGLEIEIEPYEDLRCDRSLDSSRFRAITGYSPPSWDEMVRDLAGEVQNYEQWRA